MTSQPPPASPDLSATELWLFDLDNTLYPASSGLFAQINARIRRFVQDHLGIDADAADRLKAAYRLSHHSSLRGLMQNDGVEPTRFLEFVHDIDLSPITPDPALRRAIANLPGRRAIFTNGSLRHAENVLGRLELADLFEDVFDIEAADYQPKPLPEPYRALLSYFRVAAETCVFIEDMAVNLAPAAASGMTTVWLREPGDDAERPLPAFVHHSTEDLAGWLQDVSANRDRGFFVRAQESPQEIR